MAIENVLWLDIETYSPEPIADTGNYKYAMNPDFRILLCAYAWDNAPVYVLDTDGSGIPFWLVCALKNPKVLKVAHNAVFERVCFTMALRRMGELAGDEWLDPSQWFCTMVHSVRCGYPQSLAQIGQALELKDQKMTEGKKLIQLFCLPHEARGGLFDKGPRALPADFPEEWNTFKAYCVRDVEVEREIAMKFAWHGVPASEMELYAIDQRINDRGVLLDLELAGQASRMDALVKARLNKEAMTITGLSNPNSVSQLKAWIGERLGSEPETLRKADVAGLKGTTGDPAVERVLDIRAEMGKTSTAKYDAMLKVACSDGRARGLTQFYGTRTGRWSGRLLQLQNLPQNHLDEIDFARQCLREGDRETLELCFGNVPDVLSQLIRTALVAPDGMTLAVCDFSAIEARVLAWLAGEDWVLDVFRGGGDIYCATASQMFHVPVEKHGQNADLRQKGKIAVLALGYGGSVGALDAMGGQRLGMTADEERDTVNKWREANPHIVKFWRDVERCAQECVFYKESRQLRNLSFHVEGTTLCITLPSGRMICYPGMCENINRFGRISLKYMGTDQATKKWGWIETHGGKLVENITQAVARDCLGEVMRIMDAEGMRMVFHVHDEIITEVPDESWLGHIQDIFATVPEWAEGLPLKGAGYCTPYYLKD